MNIAVEETVTSEDLAGLAEFRSKIYGFLSSAYHQTPTDDLVKKIRNKDVYSDLASLSHGIGLTQEMEEGVEDIQRFIKASEGQAVKSLHERLSVERTRLFRGIKPGYSPPPPYESVYRDEEMALMGKSAVEVLRKYAEAGVGVPDEYNEPPDHIAVELDFMRFLAGKEAESWKNHEPDNALGYLDMECDFLEAHITRWVPEFCSKVAAMAELDFFRGIAKMTKGFVTDDYQRIKAFIDTLGKP